MRPNSAPFYTALGDLIRRKRKALDLSQDRLARTLGVTRAWVEHAATALLMNIDISKAPSPIGRIAKQLGAHIHYYPFDEEISGMIHIRDGEPIIGVNPLRHPHRQRFSVAHELGHLQLHRN